MAVYAFNIWYFVSLPQILGTKISGQGSFNKLGVGQSYQGLPALSMSQWILLITKVDGN
jgi:hypothetical protein